MTYKDVKKWRQANREKYNKQMREYYQRNKIRLRKQIAERRRKYSAANPRILSDNPAAVYQRNARKKFKEKFGISYNQIYRNGKNALIAVERANRKCEKCGSSENLQIHHKDGKGRSYINKGLEPNNELNNLMVLCRSCHIILHEELNKKKGE